MSLHQTNFLQKAVGRNFWKDEGATPRITKADISRYTDWANEKIYITAPEKGNVATWDWLIDKFKEQLYSYGINIFVIDAFNKVQMPSGNRLENINDVLTKLTAFAQTNDCIIFLVAHPTKMKKEEDGTYLPPTLYDVSGSADFRNQTHDGFTIHRHFGEDARTEFVSTKVKYQFQGEIGNSASMEYDVLTSRYYELGQTPPRFDMTLPIEEQELQPVTAMKPNEDFYYDDIENEEAPF
jgi:twinkle protein